MARARLSLGLIAAAAMLGSHWAAYFLAAPDPHDRAHLLQVSGHSYWPTVITLALGAAVIGLIAFVGSRLRPEVRTSRSLIFAGALPRFLTLQVGGFLLLEVVERLTSGHGLVLTGMFLTILLVGVVVQVGAAVACSLILALIAHVIERITSRPPQVSTTSTTATLPLVSLVPGPRPVPATGAHTLRGPPLRA